MSKAKAASPQDKAALVALLLGGERRAPLTLNPSEAGPFKETAAEHKLALAQGSRRRRNDLLFALLSNATPPMGVSR